MGAGFWVNSGGGEWRCVKRVMATLQCQLSKCEHYYRFFPRPALTRLLMAPTITWAMESDSIRSMGYGKRLHQKYGLQKATQSEVWATESISVRSIWSEKCQKHPFHKILWLVLSLHQKCPLYSWAVWRSCSLRVAAVCHDTGKSAHPVSLLTSQTIRIHQQSTPRGHADDVCSMESVMCHKQEELIWIQLAGNCTPTPTVQLFLRPDHRVTFTLLWFTHSNSQI